MDFSAVCHLTLMARPFLQKKTPKKQNKNKQLVITLLSQGNNSFILFDNFVQD